MTGEELHAKYDGRLFALTHLEINAVISGEHDGELAHMRDEIGAFGFEPVEIFSEDGSPSYFGYRKCDPEIRVACVERHVVRSLHGMRPSIQFAFRSEGNDAEGTSSSTLVASGIPDEKKDAARVWLKSYLSRYGVECHLFNVQVV